MKKLILSIIVLVSFAFTTEIKSATCKGWNAGYSMERMAVSSGFSVGVSVGGSGSGPSGGLSGGYSWSFINCCLGSDGEDGGAANACNFDGMNSNCASYISYSGNCTSVTVR